MEPFKRVAYCYLQQAAGTALGRYDLLSSIWLSATQ